MKKGKRTCEVLKDVRRRVARENDIPLTERECTFEGECRGTCPHCESEVRYLEQELQRHLSLGKAVTVAGIAVSSLVMSGCHNSNSALMGEIVVSDSTEEISMPQDTEKTEDLEVPEPGQVETYEVLGIIEEPPAPKSAPQSGGDDIDDIPDMDDVKAHKTEGIIDE